MLSSENFTKIDEEFDSLLLQIKPYVMGMVDKDERQKCASWIKKLCQFTESSAWEKKNRNSYAQLLFHLLKRGNLNVGVFALNPPEGALELMSTSSAQSYLNPTHEALKAASFAAANVKSSTPSWVDTELNDTTASHLGRRSNSPKRTTSLRYDRGNYQSSGSSGVNNYRGSGNKTPELNTVSEAQPDYFDYSSSLSWKYLGSNANRPSSAASVPIGRGDIYDGDHEMTSYKGVAQSMVDEAKRQSIQKLHEQEIQSQKKTYDSKLLEEKKTLEAQYDRELKRLVEKKNEEVEMTHAQYRKKITEMESKTKELAGKLTALTQEADAMKRGKDRQIAEIKSLAHSNLETLQKEYENKIANLNSHFEEDRERLEQAHADSIQELIDDTNKRLHKMEHEYTQQQTTTAKLVEELESRINSLTADIDRTREEKFDLERRNMELEYECRTLNDGFLELKTRLEKFEHKYMDTVDSMRKDKQETVNKYENSCESLKKTHAEKVDDMMQKICDMDDRMLEMKQKLQDATLDADRKIKETQNNAKTELLSCQQGYEKKLKELQLNYDLDVKELQSKLSRCEEGVSEKDTEIEKLLQMHKREMNQSQSAFEKFRKQVDASHNQVYEEMRRQIERIESDLNESKVIREQQASEYEKSLNALRGNHEKTIDEMRAKHEEEKAKWVKDMSHEREQLSAKHDESLENLRVKLEQRIANNEIAHKTEMKKREKYLSEVESTRDRLREEINELESVRKQQLMEVGLKMEQLRTKFNSDRELIAAKCRTVADAERKDLVEIHERELKDLLLRNAEKETQIESEWRAKLKYAEENNAQLQTEIETWRNEAFREQQEHETKIEQLMKRKNAELTKMRNEHTQKVNNIINDLESTQFKVKSLEKRLIERESHYEHEMNQLVLTHNAKMKSMLPASVRQELEATIESLKSQVHSLQQTVLILQSGSGNIRSSSSPLQLTAYNQKAKLSSGKWNHDKEKENGENGSEILDSSCKDIL